MEFGRHVAKAHTEMLVMQRNSTVVDIINLITPCALYASVERRQLGDLDASVVEAGVLLETSQRRLVHLSNLLVNTDERWQAVRFSSDCADSRRV